MENLESNFFLSGYTWLDSLVRQNGLEVLLWPAFVLLLVVAFSAFILRNRFKWLDQTASNLENQLHQLNSQLEHKNNDLTQMQARLHQQEIELGKVNAEYMSASRSSDERILELKASLARAASKPRPAPCSGST